MPGSLFAGLCIMQHAEYLPAILDFLARIGIEVHREALPATTFLPGIEIRQGALVLDVERLLWPSDLLHEAGHLAVLPPAERALASDALADLPDIAGGGEVEAIAWSFAAAQALALPLEVLFHAGGYKGHSPGLALSYALGVYPGAHGLVQAGMTDQVANAAETAVYPLMRHWLRQ